MVKRALALMSLVAASGCAGGFYRGARADVPRWYRDAHGAEGATSPLEDYVGVRSVDLRPPRLLAARPPEPHAILFLQRHQGSELIEVLARAAQDGALRGADAVVVLEQGQVGSAFEVQSAGLRYGEGPNRKVTGLSCSDYRENEPWLRGSANLSPSEHLLATVGAVEGPAREAGLQPDEVILGWEVGERRGSGDCAALNESIQASKDGAEVQLLVWRASARPRLLTRTVELDRFVGAALRDVGGRVVLEPGAYGGLPSRVAGLQTGDVLLAIDDQLVANSRDAIRRIRAGPLHQRFTVRRSRTVFTVGIDTWPAALDLGVAYVTNGLVVTRVGPAAHRLGFQPGEQLLFLRGPGVFHGNWDEWPGRRTIGFFIIRQGTTRVVTLKPRVLK